MTKATAVAAQSTKAQGGLPPYTPAITALSQEDYDNLVRDALLWRKQQKDIFSLLQVIENGFTYDPGHSDLDNEQPIVVRITLGDYLRANCLYHQLKVRP